MHFSYPGTNQTFDIDDSWWAFADMRGFAPSDTCYSFPIQAATKRIEFAVVPIANIDPPLERIATRPILAKERIVPILMAIRSGAALPPVQLAQLDSGLYRLVNGFHRYSASIAVGFKQIPAVFHEISWCKPASDMSEQA